MKLGGCSPLLMYHKFPNFFLHTGRSPCLPSSIGLLAHWVAFVRAQGANRLLCGTRAGLNFEHLLTGLSLPLLIQWWRRVLYNRINTNYYFYNNKTSGFRQANGRPDNQFFRREVTSFATRVSVHSCRRGIETKIVPRTGWLPAFFTGYHDNHVVQWRKLHDSHDFLWSATRYYFYGIAWSAATLLD